MEADRAIILHEQQHLEGPDRDYIDSLGLDFAASENGDIPPFLGLSADGWSSYYVGATWLKKGCRPLVVHPKFERIDFIRIFANALSDNVAPSYFKAAYSINVDAPFIKDGVLISVLTPLMVAHFVSVMRILIAKGLKRNYVIREENLKSKVRGHIMPLQNLKLNILRGHAEQTYCRFQEYSADYPENRLLKRGLLAAESMLLSLKSENNKLLQMVRHLLMAFQNVSSDVTPMSVKSIRRDKLHGEYPEAIKLAKLILQRTDYAIAETSEKLQNVPEFAVDMSRIFEFHVLDLLRHYFENERVLFQQSAGIMGRADYLIPAAKLIVDAKYKASYITRDADTLRADIREVSGYSRSERVRKTLNVKDDSEIPCLIIYPNGSYSSSPFLNGNGTLLSLSTPYNGIRNFYTLGVDIPSLD